MENDTVYTSLLVAPPGVLASCPWCEAQHAPGKCPTAAAMTGTPLIARLRAEIAEQAIRLAEYRMVNTLATDALYRYHTLYGPLPEREVSDAK